jgi:3-oxoacyl-[acyl-carrier protein] reductase
MRCALSVRTSYTRDMTTQKPFLPGALVTGSSRGIGAAIAIRLAAAGYGVCVNYLNRQDQASDVVRAIENAGGRAFAHPGDVGSYADVERLVAATADAYNGLRILVNNAGFSQHATLDTLRIEDWARSLDVNLSSAMYTVKAALSLLRQQPWARVVNICSLRAMTGSSHGAHYAAAKAGVIGLTKSLALELAPHITVNAVSPGYTRTDMTAPSLAKNENAIVSTIPASRVAEPDDIAAVVCFLASEEAGYVTGETVNVNGGIYVR